MTTAITVHLYSTTSMAFAGLTGKVCVEQLGPFQPSVSGSPHSLSVRILLCLHSIARDPGFIMSLVDLKVILKNPSLPLNRVRMGLKYHLLHFSKKSVYPTFKWEKYKPQLFI
jgi:hypothetical protein